jgi:catechol 2,3-dioxygenase-like lactoylglutathione lyase family enzyme
MNGVSRFNATRPRAPGAGLLSVLAILAATVTPAALAADAPATAAPGRTPQGEPSAVQSLLLRAVTVTYDVERSLLFYRDILGQEVVEDVALSAERSRAWLDISPQAEVRHLILRGKGEYPGGPIAGGRISFISIKEPDGRKPPPAHPNRRGSQGDTILPHRVKGLDQIYSRLQATGFEVLFPPRTSGTGLSRNMMVFDPNGNIVELFEMK